MASKPDGDSWRKDEAAYFGSMEVNRQQDTSVTTDRQSVFPSIDSHHHIYFNTKDYQICFPNLWFTSISSTSHSPSHCLLSPELIPIVV